MREPPIDSHGVRRLRAELAVPDRKFDLARVAETIKQRHVHIGPGACPRAVYRDDFLTGLQTRSPGFRRGVDITQTGYHTRHTD